MQRIIDPENVIGDASLPNALVYGGRGFHGQDLIQRGLLTGGVGGETAHFMSLPICITELAVVELLQKGIKQPNIVSCAGVMTKTTNGVPSVHYLFGPGAKKDLKMAVANSSTKLPPLVAELVRNAESKGLKIIETTRTEHDKKMAVIQGLIHIWIILAGKIQPDNDNLRTKVVHPWKTPIETVIDMIHANPFAEEVIKDFFDILPKYDHDLRTTLMVVIDKHVSERDKENFGTPNLTRVMDYIGTYKDVIKISPSQLDAVRLFMNTAGYKFLREEIEELRN